jgi:hypothetical protein
MQDTRRGVVVLSAKRGSHCVNAPSLPCPEELSCAFEGVRESTPFVTLPSLLSSGRSWRCPVRSSRADRLDAWVWADSCQALSTPAIIPEALRRAKAGELLPTDTRARFRQLPHARRTAQRQIARLVDA